VPASVGRRIISGSASAPKGVIGRLDLSDTMRAILSLVRCP
jgi:hypothetical protein